MRRLQLLMISLLVAAWGGYTNLAHAEYVCGWHDLPSHYLDRGTMDDWQRYENNHYTGEQKDSWDNGQLLVERTWIDGKIDGVSQTYFQNGQLDNESHFKMGKLHGPVRFYHPNGHLKQEGYYEEDVPVGIFRSYDKDGHLLWEFEQTSLEPVTQDYPQSSYWAKKYYPEGMLRCEIVVENGKRIERKVYDKRGREKNTRFDWLAAFWPGNWLD